jgi:hypothetical protein
MLEYRYKVGRRKTVTNLLVLSHMDILPVPLELLTTIEIIKTQILCLTPCLPIISLNHHRLKGFIVVATNIRLSMFWNITTCTLVDFTYISTQDGSSRLVETRVTFHQNGMIIGLIGRFYRVLTMVYNTQNCWGFGLYPSSGF